MSLTIELSPDEQARLDAAAEQEGLAPAEFARKVLTDHLPPLAVALQPEDPRLALFHQWEQEGTTRTPEEAARENDLWEQFQANVNETLPHWR
jgi:hypothetical protein